MTNCVVAAPTVTKTTNTLLTNNTVKQTIFLLIFSFCINSAIEYFGNFRNCCFIYRVIGWSLTTYAVITLFPTAPECSKKAPGDGEEAEKRQGAASIVS